MTAKSLVLCCGNPAAGDDAIGAVLATRLRERLLGTHDVAVKLLAQPDVGLIAELSGWQRVIVVDACQTAAPPGTVFRWAWPEAREAAVGAVTVSSHGLGIIELLRLAEQLVPLPELILLAIQGSSFQMGAPMSPAVASAISELERQVLTELGREPAQACMR